MVKWRNGESRSRKEKQSEREEKRGKHGGFSHVVSLAAADFVLAALGLVLGGVGFAGGGVGLCLGGGFALAASVS